MTTFVIPYPVIDPVLLDLGPIVIRWYALAYIVGLIVGWRVMRVLARRPPYKIRDLDVDDLLLWVTLGVVLGGRFGYVLFYKPGFYLANPLAALRIWEGGMSFHGGLIGVLVAVALFARLRKIPFLVLGDLLAVVAPIGLLLGRIANFINAELFGRPTDVPWAMVFPTDPQRLPRHPSQLYEAFLEGVVLFTVLFLLSRNQGVRERTGMLSGAFLLGYALCRTIAELFRKPDDFLGFLFWQTTMGQLLSAPMALIGLWLILRSRAVPRGRRT